jgi:hypothetical protein
MEVGSLVGAGDLFCGDLVCGVNREVSMSALLPNLLVRSIGVRQWTFSICTLLVGGALALVVTMPSARAHGIAGNRLFPGTLSFDDPAVADEFTLSPFTSEQHQAADGSDVVDNTISLAIMRLLTPTLGIVVESGWIHRNWGELRTTGFDATAIALKGLLYKNEEHEIMLSGTMAWRIGGSGSRGVDGAGPHALEPGIFFGKGFGDLPDSLAWLRPIGIAGAITMEFPLSPTSTILGIDSGTRRLGPVLGRNVDTLHWGIAIEYSTYYLTSRFTGAPPKEEPLNQLVPLIEFNFDSPVGQKTAATMNPGLAYVGQTYQVAAEAIVPLNTEAGRGIGVRTQLLLFLDDLVPSVFGKPLLSQ